MQRKAHGVDDARERARQIFQRARAISHKRAVIDESSRLEGSTTGFLNRIEIGGPYRDRTYDQRIKSLILATFS